MNQRKMMDNKKKRNFVDGLNCAVKKGNLKKEKEDLRRWDWPVE